MTMNTGKRRMQWAIWMACWLAAVLAWGVGESGLRAGESGAEIFANAKKAKRGGQKKAKSGPKKQASFAKTGFSKYPTYVPGVFGDDFGHVEGVTNNASYPIRVRVGEDEPEILPPGEALAVPERTALTAEGACLGILENGWFLLTEVQPPEIHLVLESEDAEDFRDWPAEGKTCEVPTEWAGRTDEEIREAVQDSVEADSFGYVYSYEWEPEAFAGWAGATNLCTVKVRRDPEVAAADRRRGMTGNNADGAFGRSFGHIEGVTNNADYPICVRMADKESKILWPGETVTVASRKDLSIEGANWGDLVNGWLGVMDVQAPKMCIEAVVDGGNRSFRLSGVCEEWEGGNDIYELPISWVRKSPQEIQEAVQESVQISIDGDSASHACMFDWDPEEFSVCAGATNVCKIEARQTPEPGAGPESEDGNDSLNASEAATIVLRNIGLVPIRVEGRSVTVPPNGEATFDVAAGEWQLDLSADTDDSAYEAFWKAFRWPSMTLSGTLEPGKTEERDVLLSPERPEDAILPGTCIGEGASLSGSNNFFYGRGWRLIPWTKQAEPGQDVIVPWSVAMNGVSMEVNGSSVAVTWPDGPGTIAHVE